MGGQQTCHPIYLICFPFYLTGFMLHLFSHRQPWLWAVSVPLSHLRASIESQHPWKTTPVLRLHSKSCFKENLKLTKNAVYAPGDMIKLIVCPQGPGCDSKSKALSEFHFPTELLRSSSSVFAAIILLNQKGLSKEAIAINSFQPDAV